MTERPIFTYQTRLDVTPEQELALQAYAALYGQAERSLFAALCTGRTVNALKREFLPRFGITARQFNLPARNRAKHVWSYWGKVRTGLKAAHVAHVRSGEAQAPPAPLFSATRAVCSHRAFVAKSHDANRSQHCSESVIEDVPW